MEIPVKGLKTILTKVSDGEITDVDYFVNYNTVVYPELTIMVDVDWDKLPSEYAYNYNKYLKEKYSDIIRSFLSSLGINFSGKILFDILNWGDED